MEQTSGRLTWVDYAKGLGIIGVFALHSNAPTVLLHVIDMFCMPLFFLLSGFVFSIRKYDSFPPFLWNKLRTLVFPGIFFGVIQSAVRYFTCVMVYGIRPTLTYTEWLISFVINSRTVWLGEIPWFLACLFVIEIGGYALLRLSEHTPPQTGRWSHWPLSAFWSAMDTASLSTFSCLGAWISRYQCSPPSYLVTYCADITGRWNVRHGP